MRWELSRYVRLGGAGEARISPEDAERQRGTAAEILRRLEHQPGVVLADEVGMGKTFVALAVAASVAQADSRRRPVVVMVPSSVAAKWPKEWQVFSERCLTGGLPVRATAHTVRRGAEFLKLLDDPPETRNHLIFLTHYALTASLRDPFVRLAILRQALLYRRSLSNQRVALYRWAGDLLNHPPFRRNPQAVERLFSAKPETWRAVWRDETGADLGDDPVPDAILRVLPTIPFEDVRRAIGEVPLRASAALAARLKAARQILGDALDATWHACLSAAHVRLPLLVLDEAHHLKNPNQVAGLFADKSGRQATGLAGPLHGVFERMLFLTATPFQLGHGELLNVLRRFDGIAWSSGHDRVEFGEGLDKLHRSLDRAQIASSRLERAWGAINAEDLEGLSPRWWVMPPADPPEKARATAARIGEALQALGEARSMLAPWVIRHLRHDRDDRRVLIAGRGIVSDDATGPVVGLDIDGEAVLPFLLAARAQAVVSLEGVAEHRATRAWFAGGIASSFEAYFDTRSRREQALDDEATAVAGDEISRTVRWYVDRINETLGNEELPGHPKLAATAQRVLSLWRSGEKILVFCFYRETGRALRSEVSTVLRESIAADGRRMLGLPSRTSVEQVMQAIDARGESLFRTDSRPTRLLRARVEAIALDQGLGRQEQEQISELTLRFVRTAPFLARYVDLGSDDRDGIIERAFERTDLSEITLEEKIRRFTEHVATLVQAERDELFDALGAIQTGDRTISILDAAEHATRREVVLPNVRLANGETAQETRRRLMLAFNTPFFPEVFIASSVMGEGVDLHLDCRHVIHHDLDWNPSVLEQRNGRLDRINSKVERSGKPMVVYEPFIAGGSDEKQYRVVKDRERWFEVVMGGRIDSSEWSTDKITERVVLPREIVDELRMDLSVAPPGRGD